MGIELKGISKSWHQQQILRQVSFRCAAGETLVLLGPSGAGKSSLLNVINGVYAPQEGDIHFAGETRRRMSPHHAAELGIARTFQNIALFKGMSVLDNVISGANLSSRASWAEQALTLGRAPGEEDRQREQAEEILDFLEIQPWRQAIVGELPYGLQKRVELARALAAQPRLLLLDEPMAGMNQDEKRAMSRFIRAANRAFGATVVLIEHDIGVVMDVSDHIVALDYGKKIADGEPDTVRHHPEVIAAYLGAAH